MNRPRLLALALVAAAASGCCGAGEQTKSRRLFLEAVGPEYGKYVDADPALDAEQKARRHRTLAAEELELKKLEGK
jgi:hypothetical protein